MELKQRVIGVICPFSIRSNRTFMELKRRLGF